MGLATSRGTWDLLCPRSRQTAVCSEYCDLGECSRSYHVLDSELTTINPIYDLVKLDPIAGHCRTESLCDARRRSAARPSGGCHDNGGRRGSPHPAAAVRSSATELAFRGLRARYNGADWLFVYGADWPAGLLQRHAVRDCSVPQPAGLGTRPG